MGWMEAGDTGWQLLPRRWKRWAATVALLAFLAFPNQGRAALFWWTEQYTNRMVERFLQVGMTPATPGSSLSPSASP
ncbi:MULTISPECIES: hypothetical protein [unclassified Knoellia]|uniref:hypothetical protein n=1 Tax=Knoellia altitudinis TaxID=3404795 RepID=UPI00361808C4